MVTIVNFSHPLGEARPDVAELLGTIDYRVIDIPVQVDLSGSVVPQCDELAGRAAREATLARRPDGLGTVDVIVLPGLSVAAVLIFQGLLQLGYTPAVLRMAPTRRDYTPPRFYAAELIRL